MLKKKITTTFLLLVMIFSLTVSVSAAYMGDVNSDGKVTASDARIILRAAAKIEQLGDDVAVYADVNSDNKITASDARTVLRMAAKLDDVVEITTKAPETTTKAPETTTKAPETTTKAPETTTKAPETTTMAPETTTMAPETTTTPEPEKPSTLTAVEIHDIASKYTVEVNAYDDEYVSTGSGFFISTDGKVITNYHVIDDKYEITVTDYNGTEYEVTHVLAYDEYKDIAVLKVTAAATPAVLNYSTPSTGAVVYTLGSSKGMTDTFTNGIISNGSRVVEQYNPDMTYIQTTAPISNGNSGGPLINDKAEVIGINTWGITDGQNLNFAIPVKYIDELDYSNPLTMEEFGALFEPSTPTPTPTPTNPSSGLSLSVDLPACYLDKGGSAVVYVEVHGDRGYSDLIVSYNKNVLACEWADDIYYDSSSGNEVGVLFISALKYISYTEYITVYVEGYKDTTGINIPVTVTSDGWYDYGGYPGAVDYGAYTRVAPDMYYMGDDADCVGFTYDLYDLFNAGYDAEDILTDFFTYIEYFGFEYVDYTDSYSLTMYTFYSAKYDMYYSYSLFKDDYGDYYCVSIMFETGT